MSKMSATEKLRAMLDELGIKWETPEERWNADSITYWKVGDIKWVAFESENDTLWLNCNSVTDLTPEQAIAATMGAHSMTSLKENDVVHCKDCKYAHINMYGTCKYCDVFALKDDYGYEPQVCLDGNFFCGFGEVEES